MATHTSSQRYLSTRGGSYGLSFEEVILKGLASDNGLFIPEAIPSLPLDWHGWLNLSFEELAFQIFSLYISPAEVPPTALKEIIDKSYSTFRVPSVTPTVTLDGDKKIHALELFHGPTFAFKDVALQFLGHLFEFFLVRRNEGKTGKDREHLTIIGATSGDTGSAAIYGLRGKKDLSVFITYPTGKISSVQEAQMTTVTDENVHCLSVDGTFDDCQDFVKALFADAEINTTQRLAAVNSINWARILAQITYYFASYFSLIRAGTFDSSKDNLRFSVPSGNFGDILAGYFAKQMGLPVSKLIIATNENDILHRFWQTGVYEKHEAHGGVAEGGFAEDGVKAGPEGVKETLSPAMDILVSSNFERLLWFLSYDIYGLDAANVQQKRQAAGAKVKKWQTDLKTKGGFKVEGTVLNAAKKHFGSERVSDSETMAAIRDVYNWPSTPGSSRYILDPHSAIGVTAALRSAKAEPDAHNVALLTAHPAKFSNAVELALKEERDFQFKDILPSEFIGLEDLPRRLTHQPHPPSSSTIPLTKFQCTTRTMSAPGLRSRTTVPTTSPSTTSSLPSDPTSKPISTPPKPSASQLQHSEDNPRLTLTDILRLLLGILLLSTTLSYFLTSTLLWTYHPIFLRPARIRAWWTGPLHLTDAELTLYNGSDSSLPILLALNGTIYDVTASPHLYGPGGSYHMLAGRDATRAFVTGCFAEDLNGDLRGVEEMFLPEDYHEGGDGEGGNGVVEEREERRERKLVRERERRVARKKVWESVEGWRTLFDEGKGGKYFFRGWVERGDGSGWGGWGERKELCEQAKKGRGRREAGDVGGKGI